MIYEDNTTTIRNTSATTQATCICKHLLISAWWQGKLKDKV